MSLYSSLPEGSMRLLRLLPPSNEEPRIKCQLITCSLLDSRGAHPYEALSYVWGPENDEQSICIDGHERRVRANLHKALSNLRDNFVERILWIDTICINQENTTEKEKQVQSMAKIYAKASRVIVWLGDEVDDSDNAIETVRVAAEEQPTYPPMDEKAQQAILALLEREWFRRIWVSGKQINDTGKHH